MSFIAITITLGLLSDIKEKFLFYIATVVGYAGLMIGFVAAVVKAVH